MHTSCNQFFLSMQKESIITVITYGFRLRISQGNTLDHVALRAGKAMVLLPAKQQIQEMQR